MTPFPSDEQSGFYDEHLDDAYQRAEYVFHQFVLQVGVHDPGLDAWLAQHDFLTYAFMTPYNPHSNALPAVENEARMTDLLKVLRGRGIPFVPAEGRDPAGEWPTEHGVFLFDQPATEVHELARSFGQNAVVEGTLGGVGFLVWL